MGRRRPARSTCHDGDLVFTRPRPRRRARRHPAAPRLRRRPDRPSTTRPTCRRPTTTSPSTAGSTRGGAPTPSCTSASTARSSGCPARASACRPRCFPDAALGDLPLFYPFVVNDPGEGTQAKRRAHAVDRRPPAAADDPGRHLRRPGPAGAAARRVRPGRSRSTRPSCRPSAARSGTCSSPPSIHRDLGLADAPDDDELRRRRSLARRRLPVRAEGRPDPRRAPRPRPGARRATPLRRPGAGHHPPAPGRGARRCGRTVAAELGIDLARRRRVEIDARRGARAASWSRRWPRPAGTPHRPPTCRRCAGWLRPARARPAAQPPTRSPTCSPASTAATCPPGRAARPTRGGAHVLPTGRNFYSVDPKALPVAAGVGGRPRAGRRACSSATSPRRARYPDTVGLVLWGTAAMRTAGRRRGRGAGPARRPAGLGRPESRPGRPASSSIPLAELGRPRIDVTAAHLRLLPRRLPPPRRPARRRRRAGRPRSTRPPTTTPCARHGAADARVFGPAARRATASGILRRCSSSGNWRTDDDLAAVYLAWSGFAYGRGRLRRGRRRTPCAAGSPPSRWRSRTRTTASTTSSTPTTTSRTTAA